MLIFQYMFIAISHDPMIEDRKTALKNFCLRVKQLKTDTECDTFLTNMHSFAEPEEPEEPEDNEGSELNFDNISEASFDLDVLNSLKAEINES